MALFMTPEQVAAQEGQARAGVGDNYESALTGSLFNLGHNLGDMGQRAVFGTDTRSKAVKDAQFITQTVKQVDFSKPETIMTVANQLNDAGYVDQAFKFLSAIPPSVKPPEVWSEPYFETKVVGNTTKQFRMQKNQYGQVRNIGEISNTVSDTVGSDIGDVPQSVYDGVNLTATQKENGEARLRSDPAFKSLLDSTGDEVELGPMMGEIESVANQLKAESRNKYLNLAAQGKISYEAIPALLAANGGDDAFYRQAFKDWKEGGGWKQSLQDSMIYGGATVEARGDVDTADLGTLRQNIALNEARQVAVSKVAMGLDAMVAGDTTKGEFRMKAVDPVMAKEVFSGAKGVREDEELRTEFENRGFVFTPELYNVHAQRWELMRENPKATELNLTYAEDPDLLKAARAKYIDSVIDDDVIAFANATAIFTYFDRLAKNKETTPVQTRRNSMSRFPSPTQ